MMLGGIFRINACCFHLVKANWSSATTRELADSNFLRAYGNLGQLPHFGSVFALLSLLKCFISRYGGSGPKFRRYSSSLFAFV